MAVLLKRAPAFPTSAVDTAFGYLATHEPARSIEEMDAAVLREGETAVRSFKLRPPLKIHEPDLFAHAKMPKCLTHNFSPFSNILRAVA